MRLCLSKYFFVLSRLIDSLPVRITQVWKRIFLRILKAFFHCLLASTVPSERSKGIMIPDLLYKLVGTSCPEYSGFI